MRMRMRGQADPAHAGGLRIAERPASAVAADSSSGSTRRGARNQGSLGSAWTTVHLYYEQEMADLLAIPCPRNTQAGLFPIAYTIGTRFSPGERAHSAERVFWNRSSEQQPAQQMTSDIISS
jgi:hypothetical protein